MAAPNKNHQCLNGNKESKMHSLTESVTCTTADINVNMENMKSKWCDLPLNCDICLSQDSSRFNCLKVMQMFTSRSPMPKCNLLDIRSIHV